MCGTTTAAVEDSFSLARSMECNFDSTPRHGESSKKRRVSAGEALALLASGEEPCHPPALDTHCTSAECWPSLLEPLPGASAWRGQYTCGFLAHPRTRSSELRDEDAYIQGAARGCFSEYPSSDFSAAPCRKRPSRAPRRPTKPAICLPSTAAPSSPRPLLLGQALPERRAGPASTPGRYVLESKIGEGAFATVWRSIDTKTGGTVALKIPSRDVVSTVLGGAVEEAAMRAIAGHPHAVALLDCWREPGNPASTVVMPYARGGDLLDYVMENGPLCEQEARRHFHGVVSAIGALHTGGWCHRDVKLENILLSTVSQCSSSWLADFGECVPLECGSRLVASPRGRGAGPRGSPSYCAPELNAGEDYDGIRADLFSCGVVLYAMAAGEFPFGVATSTCPRWQRILAGDHEWPSHFSPSLVNLLSKLLAASPGDRFGDAEDVLRHPWLVTEGFVGSA